MDFKLISDPLVRSYLSQSGDYEAEVPSFYCLNIYCSTVAITQRFNFGGCFLL